MEQKGENQENICCYKNLYTYGPFNISSKFSMSRSSLKYMMTMASDKSFFHRVKKQIQSSCNAFE